ncbi:MAG: bile acid:sodium symporter family protein [Gammaproteobacteria bacterium]|nr:MAG: bile acid:sodium symporter family protein [Gammaproteobacteria bacterium]
MITRLTQLFPVWAVLLSVIAHQQPQIFTPLREAIVPLLGIVMFGMGLTLTPANFAEVLSRPRLVAIGVGLQFGAMPLAAWLIGHALGLPPALLAGLVLVGACPGGTASNVICYLARGDVALSITLTTVSTFVAVLLTPALTWLYVGQTVPVPVVAMLWSICKIVLLPVAGGVLINRVAHDRLGPARQVFPLVSVMAIVLIIAVIVALNVDNLARIGLAVTAAVMLHNLAGLASGYGISRLLGCDRRAARTVAIEVGMQNSGLGVALAVKYFSAVAAVPGALFSVWHNLSGSVLAGWWARGEPGARRQV